MIRREQWSWALYDWANSAWATTVLVGLFPIFFNQYWATGVAPATRTFYLGAIGNSVPALIVVLLAPVLGVMADRRGLKKRFLAVTTLLGAGATAALFWVPAGAWGWALALFALSGVGFFCGLGFYDSLLLNVAAAPERDRVSAFGYGLGYLGGGLLFLVNVQMVLQPAWFGLESAAEATRWAFLSVAVWWLLFSLPLFWRVPERRESRGEALGWRGLLATLAKVRRNRPVLLFLLAYWLYIDAVGTVANMAVDFGLKLGFASDALIKALLIVQFVSFPAALAFGWLAGRIGARGGIYLAIAVYCGITVWALFMRTEAQFYQMAAAVGLVQGGIQALSRSYYAQLIPPEQAGEYYGFYNMLGKFAAILGPLVVGLTAALTGDARLSLFVLIFFFLGGALLLSRVPAPLR
ncbi:MAG TPA: MFS transporter [Nevskiaceae bacterium]|nr:MFS transporter [Nevskiaceae bacterium]